MAPEPTTPPAHEEDRLRHVLGFVDGHVKFAETKNAALFTANAATIFAVIQILTGAHADGRVLRVYLVLLMAANVVSAVTALLSFLPVTQLPWLKRPRRRALGANLLFFGDVQQYDGRSYVDALLNALGAEPRASSAFERMLAGQVVVNAKIAAKKFTYFKIALWATLFGVLTPPIGAALLWWVIDQQPNA